MKAKNQIRLSKYDDISITDSVVSSEIVLEIRSLYGDIIKFYLEPSHIVQLYKSIKDYQEVEDATHKG